MPSRRLVMIALAGALSRNFTEDAESRRRRKKRKKRNKAKPDPTPQPTPTCTGCLSCESCIDGTCKPWPNYVGCKTRSGANGFCINGACAESCSTSCSGNRLCRLRSDGSKVCALPKSCEDQGCGGDAHCGRGGVCTVNMCGAGTDPTGICTQVA